LLQRLGAANGLAFSLLQLLVEELLCAAQRLVGRQLGAHGQRHEQQKQNMERLVHFLFAYIYK